jgi:hypothetical protein
MLPNNFDQMTSKYPKYSDAIRAVCQWIADRPGVRFIELERLIRELPHVHATSLAAALRIMSMDGLLSTTFRVEDPLGVQLEGDYEKPSEVPDRIPDSDGYRPFSPEKDGRIVPGYLLSEAAYAQQG